MTITEQVSAAQKLGRAEALELAHAARQVIVAKGKKLTTFDMQKEPPDDDTLAKHLLGPTGNLRAPTIRAGKLLLVGFNEAVFGEQFGGRKEIQNSE